MSIQLTQGKLFDEEVRTIPATAACLQTWAPHTWVVDEGWQPVIDHFWASAEGRRLSNFLRSRLEKRAVVYPPHPFRALMLTPLRDVKVVILGQDPYHGPGQGEGLAFSVTSGVKLPPSLRNIFKELMREGLLTTLPGDGSLQAWARQGVLLLNSALTVEDGQAASHAGKGWEALSDALLAHVATSVPKCVYLLWGAHAQVKADLVVRIAVQHGHDVLVLRANHPSPLSALRPPVPFIGCGHFGQTQRWLEARGLALDWSL